jgi:hypothetical protein
MSNMTQDNGKKENHRTLFLKTLAFSGWGAAILLLLLGSYYLNKMHLEIVSMQRENKELKLSLERARARQSFSQEQ